MIELTRINGGRVTVNKDLIVTIEETPDTLLSFTNGQKLLVKESRQDVIRLVKEYEREIRAGL